MPKLLQRLLIFFIGIPVVIGIIIFKFANHLPFHCLLLLFSFLAATEMVNMLNTKSQTQPKVLLVLLSVIQPISAYLCGFFSFDFVLVTIVYTFSILTIFAFEIFTSQDFENSNTKIANSIFTITYAGFLPTFISRLSTFTHSVEVICLFVIFVFISDSAAWLFGMLFGKNNRGILKASPNKSVAGFIGAYIGTIGVAFLIRYVFLNSLISDGTLLKLIILAVSVTTASIIGDLAESVFKRSAGVKDSGNVILGRGGALDSIDSMLASAPFYYFIIMYILN